MSTLAYMTYKELNEALWADRKLEDNEPWDSLEFGFKHKMYVTKAIGAIGAIEKYNKNISVRSIAFVLYALAAIPEDQTQTYKDAKNITKQFYQIVTELETLDVIVKIMSHPTFDNVQEIQILNGGMGAMVVYREFTDTENKWIKEGSIVHPGPGQSIEEAKKEIINRELKDNAKRRVKSGYLYKEEFLNYTDKKIHRRFSKDISYKSIFLKEIKDSITPKLV